MFRARSRSPLSHTKSTGQQEYHDFYILNIPLDWKFNKIKSFIRIKTQNAGLMEPVKYVNVLKDEKGVSKGACIVQYADPNACKVAMKIMMGAECEGRKLVVLKDASNILNHQAVPRNNPKEVTSAYESYGLSANFLNSLEINPPLITHLHVSNLSFDITDEKLHEVFSLAGQVIHITHMKSADGKSRGIAKIIYDHPVEAVQAISMFHGQMLLDRNMHVKMDRMYQQKESSLPIGLSGIGPGLGHNGEPMRGVRVSLELQPIKQMLIDELEKLRDENKSQNTGSSLQENSAVNATSGAPSHQLLQMLQGASASNISTTLAALRNQNSGLVANAVGVNANGQNFNQNMAQNVQSMVQSVTPFAHNLTGMGQNVTNLPNFGQNVANMHGLTHNMQNFAHNLPAMAQTLPALMQNMPNLAQSMLMNQNIGSIANQNPHTLAQNASAIGTSVQNLGQNVANLTQENSTSSEWKLQGQSASHQSSNQHTDSFSHKRKRPGDSRSKSKERDDSNRIKSSDMVIFKNLPSSVSLQSLTNKMREVGELKFTDMTGEGRALVRFLNVDDAERCVKLFHRSKVDGQTIEVKFF